MERMSVELLYGHTSPDGSTYQVGETVSLPKQEAADLIYFGRAKEAAENQALQESAPGAKKELERQPKQIAEGAK